MIWSVELVLTELLLVPNDDCNKEQLCGELKSEKTEIVKMIDFIKTAKMRTHK